MPARSAIRPNRPRRRSSGSRVQARATNPRVDVMIRHRGADPVDMGNGHAALRSGGTASRPPGSPKLGQDRACARWRRQHGSARGQAAPGPARRRQALPRSSRNRPSASCTGGRRTRTAPRPRPPRAARDASSAPRRCRAGPIRPRNRRRRCGSARAPRWARRSSRRWRDRRCVRNPAGRSWMQVPMVAMAWPPVSGLA